LGEEQGGGTASKWGVILYKNNQKYMRQEYILEDDGKSLPTIQSMQL